MIQTMQSELFRIRKSRLFWACLVLAAFFVFALALTFYHNSVNGMLPVISLVSFTEFLFSDYSLIFPLTLFLCLYFTEDFHTGTYSITLSKGTSRVHLFFGKLLASWGGVLFFLFVCFGVAYLSILMMGASRYDIKYGPKCQRRFAPCFHNLNAPFPAFFPVRCSPSECQCSL